MLTAELRTCVLGNYEKDYFYFGRVKHMLDILLQHNWLKSPLGHFSFIYAIESLFQQKKIKKTAKQCYQIWFWGLIAFYTDFVHKIGNKRNLLAGNTATHQRKIS
jgi:hypothetical protein